ncbi:hypothetical protein NQZ68_000674 [Dissostichus eleginoides]|nr:hypothetical protein NQZ68_000674 [Dissostichus eleginoides]
MENSDRKEEKATGQNMQSSGDDTSPCGWHMEPILVWEQGFRGGAAGSESLYTAKPSVMGNWPSHSGPVMQRKRLETCDDHWRRKCKPDCALGLPCRVLISRVSRVSAAIGGLHLEGDRSQERGQLMAVDSSE